MIKSCQSQDDFTGLLTASRQKPVVLLKHSTACPISRNANSEFEKFASAEKEVECWKILILECRPLSRAIAELTGIRHESPQAIIFIDEKPVWHASHWSITGESLRNALKDCRGRADGECP